MSRSDAGIVLVLNGAPRSGKSSIVEIIQATFDGVWMNLGVDVYVRHVTPPKLRPGIGLRPGGERPDLEPVIATMYAALYESAAAHSRLGLNVVMDLGHHEAYSAPLQVLRDCARRLEGLPAYFVGIRCPIATILERRAIDQPGREGQYAKATPEDPVPAAVARWQRDVHLPGIYDMEVDTSVMSPSECTDVIRRFIQSESPTAFERLATGDERFRPEGPRGHSEGRRPG